MCSWQKKRTYDCLNRFAPLFIIKGSLFEEQNLEWKESAIFLHEFYKIYSPLPAAFPTDKCGNYRGTLTKAI